MYSLLHAHTDLSNSRLIDSINKPKALLQYCYNLGLKGCAFTDHESIGAHIDGENFIEEQIKNKKGKLTDEQIQKWKDFKFIRGNEIYLCRNGLNSENYDGKKDRFYHFILLAKDEIGHEQLRELSTTAYKQSFMKSKMLRPPTYYKDLEKIIGQNPGHIVGSTACLGGWLPSTLLSLSSFESHRSRYESEIDIVYRWLNYIQNIFGVGNFYLELQPSNNIEQVYVNKKMIEISDKLNIPCIITTDAHYLSKEKRAIHEAYLKSKDGDREVHEFYNTTYVMSPEEIHSFMDKEIGFEKVDELLNNTVKISDSIQKYSLKKPFKLPFMVDDRSVLSVLPNKLNGREMFAKFFSSEEESDRIFIKRIVDYMRKGDEWCPTEKWFSKATVDKLEEELKNIWISSEQQKLRWTKYLLQMADYIEEIWRSGDTIMAPGRGSAVSSILNYILGITQINPLLEKAPMKAWRFINPERASIVDIDTDIQSNRRDRAIFILQRKHGEFRVVRVMTKKTEGSRSSILTAARGLGIDVDTAQYLASFIESDRGLQRTLAQTAYGDVEKDIAPNNRFREEMEQNFPELWEVAQEIEGLVNGVSSHAGGVIIVDEEFTKTNSIIKLNSGEYVSAFDLHQSEELSNVKIDLLATEGLTKIRTCLDLLTDYGYVDKKLSLKQRYERIIGVYNLDRTSEDMWKMTWNNQIISLFQMEKDSGVKGIALTKPICVEDLATLNSVMRLMASEKGAEQPLEKYARFKSNHGFWEEEMEAFNLNPKEKELIRKHLATSHGICESQEGMMSLLLEPTIAGWSLGEVDMVRKSVAKKDPKLYDELSAKFFKNAKDKELSPNLTSYVWNVLVNTQRGYSFNLSHTLSYSIIALQEMNLAYKYPIIFWNTANLIVDSASDNQSSEEETENLIEEICLDTICEEEEEAAEDDEDDEDEDEEEDDLLAEELGIEEEGRQKVVNKKNKVKKTVDYGKIAIAIGRFKAYGLDILPPDINSSSYTFTPNVDDNTISYGLRGITKISSSIINKIIENRPYKSLEDFLSRNSISKDKMTNLIKCGAFDRLEKISREKILKKYLRSVSETKNRVTLQNMRMLLNYNLIPEEYAFYGKLFNFNKFLKDNKEDRFYVLSTTGSQLFYSKYFDMDLLVNQNKILQGDWDRIYKTKMKRMSDYLKSSQAEVLESLNEEIISELWNKYGVGNVSKWEMDSISFYYHPHELANVNTKKYYIEDFYDLPESNPDVVATFISKEKKRVVIPRTSTIVGTVLDRNKNKHTVALLTLNGVVNVKIWSNQFSKYDRQISEVGADGKKHVIDKSWFKRGSLLMLTGVRRENDFIPKINKYSLYSMPVIKIEKINEDNSLVLRMERAQ